MTHRIDCDKVKCFKQIKAGEPYLLVNIVTESKGEDRIPPMHFHVDCVDDAVIAGFAQTMRDEDLRTLRINRFVMNAELGV
jgi:hypothetical protein